ncbi:uncharacterized protein LOC131544911 isoform X2 [Onychostoma macrolepis]|uniref:Uncharacterized protein n=1 Tax=Onychostoma macrolepis TaxID=369639 RepID=A0A7J6CWG7_9TELE|nr:uncharacterized protein LOC131544911 isoform X2 [Onychostoma macrolepis]KAF4111688.1 hypothetical protein G5714_008719 [Onychostoma macrolepis]
MERTVTEDTEAVLSLQEHLSSSTAHLAKRRESSDARPRRDQTPQPSDADSLLKLMETSPASVGELEESHQGLHPGPSVVSDALRSSSSAHITNTRHPPHLQPSLHFPTSVQKHNVKPVPLFADVNPSFLVHPHAMPSWPVLVPHLSASASRHQPFCPVYTPLPCKASFRAVVACEDPIRTHADGSAPDVQGCFRRRQRLFCSARSDAEALACFFTSVVPAPDLPLSSAQDWRNTSDSQRQQYYTAAQMFTETEEQHKNANRADRNHKGRRPQHSSGKVKKTAKRCKKEPLLQDLAESALTEYSQVMDSLESKVTEGSEVTDEEDVCALFLNQMLNDSESMTEAGFDMDYINSLLSSDQNISDVLKDNPEPVAGCSDWTPSTVSEAQSLPPSAIQLDLSPFNGTNLLLSEDPMMENKLAPFQDNVKDQTVFQMFTEPLLANPESQSSQTDLNASVQETLHLDLQDFGPEADGNLKHKTLYVDELNSATQSNCFSLQNYKSHHASFPHSVKHGPEPLEALVNGEEITVVRPKTEKYMNVGSAKGNNKMDLDIPDDSQRTRKDCNKQTNLKESLKIDQIEENNVKNKSKKHRRQHRRQKITLPVMRTSSKLDDKDERRLKTIKYQTQRKSANATKHEASEQETDLIKINMKRVELQNISEATSSAMEGRRASLRQQVRKIRDEHLDDEFERRQRRLKMGGRVGNQRTIKTERDGAKTYQCSEGGRPKKQGNLSVEEDRGDFRRKTEAHQRLRRETRPKRNVKVTNVSEKVYEMST